MLDSLYNIEFSKKGQCYAYKISMKFFRSSLDKAIKSIDSKPEENDNAPRNLLGRILGASIEFFNTVLAYEAIATVRKAFIIQAYHNWEKFVCKCFSQTFPSEKVPRGFDDLSKAAERMGFILHPELNLVSDLSNVLKHDSKKSCERLLSEWPKLFSPDPEILSKELDDEDINWTSNIKIDDKWIDKIFSILEKSGPPENPQ
ncbi:Hypothetical protein GOX2366 [Gluconobacter oxydans 621H]|uniref:Uncharacterized protein n=1 Tax=Gluconobacter oxydans (strain 621H) TaxID=290633 RepID=Q5FNE9_GLUOX|nr:hypothetical protein [Gluconobacter oxydans]AAW62098.1 Hypothetical protein GOX2366 [Gluconobacter oxydans 621H]